MPIYMDRHHIGDGIAREDMVHAHDADLAIQHEYQAKFLTYWYDHKNKSVFCLVDAPNPEAIHRVHEAAHGSLPNEIIEVDLSDVESFLGRISDPQPNEEGIIYADHAFRVIMFTDLKGSTSMLTSLGDAKAIEYLETHDRIIREEIIAHNGREIKHTGDGFMVAFNSVDEAVRCAIHIQEKFTENNAAHPEFPLHVRIGLNAGQPVERSRDLFGVTVTLASRVCDHGDAPGILSAGIIYTLLHDEDLRSHFEEHSIISFKGFEIDHPIQVFNIHYNTFP